MDERLEKALDFSNYALTINNQKRNIRNRVAQLQIIHHLGGVFIANHETIAFIKTLIDFPNPQLNRNLWSAHISTTSASKILRIIRPSTKKT